MDAINNVTTIEQCAEAKIDSNKKITCTDAACAAFTASTRTKKCKTRQLHRAALSSQEVHQQ